MSATTMYTIAVVAAIVAHYHMRGTPVMSESLKQGALDELDKRISLGVAVGVGIGVGTLGFYLTPVVNETAQYAVALGVGGFLVWNHYYTTYVSGRAAKIAGSAIRTLLRNILFIIGGATAGYKKRKDDDSDEDN